MKIKSKLVLITILLISFQTIFAQGEHSLGQAPGFVKSERVLPHYQEGNALANTGYGVDLASPNKFVSMPIPAGTPLTTINNNLGNYLICGADIDESGDFFGCTQVTQGYSEIIKIDLSTGIPTFIAGITGFSYYATSLAYNSSNSTWYFGSTNIAESRLYTLNILTGSLTYLGPITGLAGLMSLAIDCDGNAYGIDIVSDQLFSINLSTGAGTPIGPLVFNANYGQDADFDAATNTLYLAAFNDGAFQGEFRSVDLTTGSTTFITAWPGSQITGFAIDNTCGPPCPVGAPSNPNPPDSTLNVPIYGSTLSWVNGSGTLDVELWFGPYYDVVKVYDGPIISSFALPTLDYYTQYRWYIVCKNDTCANQGSIWNFTTQTSFGWVFDIHPLNIDYWTGTCDPTVKTQNSLVKADGNGYAGWMVFDTTPLGNDPNITIMSVEFNAYLCDNNWPYWAITPMGYVNPITGTASEVYSQVSTSYTEGTAYSYNPETGSLDNGWIQRELTDGGANQALENALSQGWFAIGIYDWDNSPIYYLRFQGLAEGNKPFLRVNYLTIPVELTSFTAEVDEDIVTLFWQTATETNNSGFEIERLKDSKIEKLNDWERIGFIEGKGTTTEIQSYSFTDSPEPGIYQYRLKQIDFDGTFTFSDEVNVEVEVPLIYALEQNYPNPFNPNTTIKYSISEDGFVKLSVYNLLGEEVTMLVNSEQKAGRYEVMFDASKLSSGVYMYRLESQNFLSIKKMILIK